MRKTALLSFVFFVAIGIASTTFAFFGFAREPKLAALFFGCFWGFWVLLSVWLLTSFSTYRLHVGESALCEIGVIRQCVMPLCDIHEVTWRTIPKPNGSVRLSGVFGAVVIEFALLKSDDCHSVIMFLREMIDTNKHVGWDEFSQRQNEIREGEQSGESDLPSTVSH